MSAAFALSPSPRPSQQPAAIASKNTSRLAAIRAEVRSRNRNIGLPIRLTTVQNYLSVSGALVSAVGVGLSAEALEALDSFSPFSNSDLAEPRFFANFGMAAPPKRRTPTTTTTITPSIPNISPKNTAFSFDVLGKRVAPPTSRSEE